MEQNSNSRIGKLVDNTIDRIRDIVNVDTVVGSSITTPDGITIIPISRVSYAFASGGSDFRVNEHTNMGFGGGNGAGVKIEPIGFLTIKDGNVRMINIMPPANTTVDRALEKIPDVIELVETLVRKRANEKKESNE